MNLADHLRDEIGRVERASSVRASFMIGPIQFTEMDVPLTIYGSPPRDFRFVVYEPHRLAYGPDGYPADIVKTPTHHEVVFELMHGPRFRQEAVYRLTSMPPKGWRWCWRSGKLWIERIP